MGAGGLPSILGTMQEELAIAGADPECCPMRYKAITVMIQSLSTKGLTKDTIKDYSKCYECDGKDKSCLKHINLYRKSLLDTNFLHNIINARNI